MKKTDYIGIAFLVLFALLVMFFPWNFGLNPNALLKGEMLYWTGFEWSKLENFGNITKEFPYIMGFLKFALLATFGEMLKHRIKTGNWHVTKLPVRVLIWGFYGMVMTAAFSLFASGTAVMMSGNLWSSRFPPLSL